MRITCPACQASYEIPDHLLVSTPERVRCARCGAEWSWARALHPPAENFELPDLFSAGPVSQATPEPFADLSALTDGGQIREPIGSPVYDPSPEPSLPPVTIQPPRVHDESPVEIPEIPVVKEPVPPPHVAADYGTSREEAFRRVVETTRQRSVMPPQPQSRRPQVIAILAIILLIALIFGAHFVMVNGVTAAPAG